MNARGITGCVLAAVAATGLGCARGRATVASGGVCPACGPVASGAAARGTTDTARPVEASLASAGSRSEPEALPEAVRGAAARAAYERFKALEGEWVGKSTKGWEERVSYTTIAAGSCVLETSFDAHPNETMLTLVHLDGDRLMLTHYCVAKNQPRLIASRISDEGREILFTFLDATNLSSRDAGHMDSCRVVFESPDRVTTQWTWYQNGKETWMEEIALERVKGEVPRGE